MKRLMTTFGCSNYVPYGKAASYTTGRISQITYPYDFGASAATRQTLITYGTWNGTSCVALSGQTVSLYIVGTPCDAQG